MSSPLCPERIGPRPQRGLRPDVLWLLAFAYLLRSTPGHAVELEISVPAPTLVGSPTTVSAQLSAEVGEAQLRWDLGDGTTTEFSAEQTSVTHTYGAAGHYTISALAQDDAGFASQSFIHTVHTLPTAIPARSSSKLLFHPGLDLYVAANTQSATVSLVDAGTLQKVQEIPVFSSPVAAAWAPDGLLWVVHQEDYAISLVDVGKGAMVDFFRLPYASLPAGIVFAPSGDAYVPLMARGEVLRLDSLSHEILAQEPVAPFLRGITISGDGASLWVTRFISAGSRGEVYRLDPLSLATLARYDLVEDTTTTDSDHAGRGLPNYLFSVAVSPDGKRAWVPAKKDNLARGLMRDGLALTQDNAVRPLVALLDLETDEELLDLRLDLDDRNLPRQVSFSPLGDWAFVSLFGSNLVDVRDAFDGSFVTALRADTLRGPAASVFTPDQHLAVLADLSRTLVVFDLSDLLTGADQSTRVLAEIPLVAHETLAPEVLRGAQIFANAEDKRMASEGYLSCASCHFEGFEDGQVWDFFDRGEGFRNTTSLLGRRGMGHGRVHWSGNFDEIQDFDGPIRAHQGGLGFIPLEEFQQGTRSDPLGDPKAGLDPDLDALAAYVASLEVVPRSPFRSADGSLTPSGVRGEAIFRDLGCDTCHAGEDFTDSPAGELHDVGTLTELSGDRLGAELTGIDTPTLLGIWQTAPYLHDGSAPTLRDVLTTRNPEDLHGETSSLSETELDDLVAYLQQIDAGLPPTELHLPSPEPTMGGQGGEGGNPPGEVGGVSAGGAASGGAGGSPPLATGGAGPGATPGGCSCRVASGRPPVRPMVALGGLVLLASTARRRRRSERAALPR